MTTYKAIATKSDGSRQMVRCNKDNVAHIVSEFRKFQRNLFGEIVKISVIGIEFTLNEICGWLFINEYTREKLEIS